MLGKSNGTDGDCETFVVASIVSPRICQDLRTAGLATAQHLGKPFRGEWRRTTWYWPAMRQTFEQVSGEPVGSADHPSEYSSVRLNSQVKSCSIPLAKATILDLFSSVLQF